MDILLVLVVILILVLMWRGPKTLPLLGRAFGQGVREARKELDAATTDAPATDAAPTDAANPADETRRPKT